MTITTQQLLQLKEQVKELQEKAIRADAAFMQAMAHLKELGYDSIEQADGALEELKQTVLDGEAQLAEDVDTLYNSYPDLR